MWSALDIAFGRIMTSRLAGALKSVLVNLELLDEDDSSTDEPMWGPPGFFCRPRPPVAKEDATGLDPEGACEAVALRVADRAVPISYRDLRLSSVVNPSEGELGLAHYGGGFVSLKLNTDEDGTNIVLYAPRKDSSGAVVKASCLSMDSTDGNQHISMMHEYGHSITMTKEGKTVIANKAGTAYLEVNDDGISLNGNSALTGSLRELTVGNPLFAEGLMMSTDLLTWIIQVNLALTTLAAAVGGMVPAIVAPVAVPKASQIAKASEQAL